MIHVAQVPPHGDAYFKLLSLQSSTNSLNLDVYKQALCERGVSVPSKPCCALQQKLAAMMWDRLFRLKDVSQIRQILDSLLGPFGNRFCYV